jgi:hypothetical protein
MKKTKRIIPIISQVLFSAAMLYAGYILSQRLGIGFILFFSLSGLAVLSGTVYSAPEGYEDAGGFHIKRLRRRSRLRRNPLSWLPNPT